MPATRSLNHAQLARAIKGQLIKGMTERTHFTAKADGSNSKHQAKQAARSALDNLKNQNPKATKADLAADPAIYSRGSLNTYSEAVSRICDIGAAERPKKWGSLEQAKAFFGEYAARRANECMAGEIKPNTVHTEVAAMAKALNVHMSDILPKDKLPERRSADFVKNRGEIKGYSEAKNPVQTALGKATGLRRSELKRIKPEDFGPIPADATDRNGRSIPGADSQKGKFGVKVESGKGGKDRWAVVRPEMVADVKSMLGNHPEGQKLFSRDNPVRSRYPGHAYRREYAKALYEDNARPVGELPFGERYHCRGERFGQVYDKKALQVVSWMLGHSRLNVVVLNYLN